MSSETLFGWGSSSEGQLASTASDIHLTPKPLSIPSPHIFAAGLWSSVFANHQAVYTTTQPSQKPQSLKSPPVLTPIPNSNQLPSLQSLAVGRDFILFLTTSGALYSVGSNAYGQLGLPDLVSSTAPQHIQTLSTVRIVSIAAAEFHWLALDALGRVFSCGNNSSAQLGLNHTHPVSKPTHVTSLFPHPIVAVSTGDVHSAVLSANGVILCFGSNKHGQLGQAAFRVRVISLTPLPVTVPPRNPSQHIEAELPDYVTQNQKGTPASTQTFIDVACGSAHTVALRSDGVLVCWGKGENGQLGTRATCTMYEPVVVAPNLQFVSVSAGDRHSAALTKDGILYTWGDGSMGQIGDGDLSDKYVPIALRSPKLTRQDAMEVDSSSGPPVRYIRVECGGFHTLALAANGAVPVFSASATYVDRIPRCIVDNMFQPKAGLARFGSAAVLLRTFVNPSLPPLVEGKVRYLAAETAHLKFLRTFREEGKRVLQKAAARIRREAQVAFGLVTEDHTNSVLTMESDEYEHPSITSRLKFLNDVNLLRSNVANSHESGYLFFLALMNPIYSDIESVPELSELAAILLHCEDHAREAFLEMVSHIDEETLTNRFIRPYQSVLTLELKRYHRITRNAIFAAKALALSYHAVWRSSRRKKIRGLCVPRRVFYNETVSDLVDFGEDYGRWLESQPLNPSNSFPNPSTLGKSADTAKGTNNLKLFDLPPLPCAGQEDGPFSFCTYSFLLNESAKFRVLEIESKHTMTKESRRSELSFGALSMPIGPLGRLSHMRLPPEHMAHLKFLVLNVRRDHIVSDTFYQIAELVRRHPRELHKPLKVIFDGEDGVDEGGVRKEFYQVLLERIMSPDYGMFECDDDTNFHMFRRDFLEPDSSWTLIGILFGLAAFNSILLDVQFPPVVYRKLEIAFRNNLLNVRTEASEAISSLGYEADLEDVLETFPAIGNSLRHLREYKGSDVDQVFCLTFEVSYQGLFGKMKTVELVENGSKVAVDNSNRELFISLYTDWLINKSINVPFTNFTAGFSSLLSGPFVHTLTADELETLVAGEKDLDFAGLRQSAKYEGYTEQSPVIVNLWQVLSEYDEKMKRLFLSFVTGTDRAPIGGLKKLTLIIQRAGGDSSRLPTSHTCFNVILLPAYTTRAKLRDRLSTAIRNSKGFGLR